MMATLALQSLNRAVLSAPERRRPISATKRSSKRTASVNPTAKKVLVPIGLGTEEMEAVILAAVLRRAGAHVLLASVEPELEVRCSSGTKLVADTLISDCADEMFDLVALPGGMPGAVRLRDCEILRNITIKQAEEKRLYGAICAAPAVALVPWGLHRRRQITCHPAFMDKLPSFRAVKSNLQVSGELTTSRGPGTTFEFALSFVEQLFGETMAEDVRGMLLMRSGDDHHRKEVNQVEWLFGHPPQVLVPVANGCEEVELVILVDILRRAKVDVVVASVERSTQIVASQRTKIVTDKFIEDASESTFDLIILPGGLTGSDRLHKSKVLKKLLKEQKEEGRIYGGICSSTTILQKQGLLVDKVVTAHPAVVGKLTGQIANGAGVVIDGKLITCRGIGNVINFSLAIVNKLFGQGRARSVAEGIVFEYGKS